MASRLILTTEYDIKLVQKVIQVDDEKIFNIHFPFVEEVKNNPNSLRQALNNIKDPMRQAILQQYNEILIYNAAPPEYRDILAPQLKITYSPINNLPIILYPNIMPLANEKEPNNLTTLFYICYELYQRSVDINKIKDFFDKLQELCLYFGLVEDDIVNNFQNIGYNDYLGLRILDYGLCEDDIFIG